jgi:hypothetical protein
MDTRTRSIVNSLRPELRRVVEQAPALGLHVSATDDGGLRIGLPPDSPIPTAVMMRPPFDEPTHGQLLFGLMMTALVPFCGHDGDKWGRVELLLHCLAAQGDRAALDLLVEWESVRERYHRGQI